MCETGGGRRTWLRGRVNVTKRYLMQVAAHNLGLVMRKLFGVGKPRRLQGAGGAAFALVLWLLSVLARLGPPVVWPEGRGKTPRLRSTPQTEDHDEMSPFSTGCKSCRYSGWEGYSVTSLFRWRDARRNASSASTNLLCS